MPRDTSVRSQSGWIPRTIIVFFILIAALLVSLPFWAPKIEQDRQFEAEFGRSLDDPDRRVTELAVMFRLVSLCAAYEDSAERAETKRQVFSPRTLHRDVQAVFDMGDSASQRVADEEEVLAGKRYSHALILAKLLGPEFPDPECKEM